jgi:hypothetical protein
MSKLVLGVCGVLAAAVAGRADVESGPKEGEKVPALKVHAVVGPVENKDVDYAAERKDAPTVYLFVNAEKFSRPIARYLKELDKQLGDIDEKAAGVAIWFAGDADGNKTYMPRLNMSVKFEKTALTVFTGDGFSPDGWGLNFDAHLTVVVTANGKVVKSFGYSSVNETDVKSAVEVLKKAVKK